MNMISMIFLIMSIIILITTMLLERFYKKFDSDDAEFGYIVSLILVVVFVVSLVTNKVAEEPKAIDVYRGKTQIVLNYNTDGTYDSIVVWKGGDK